MKIALEISSPIGLLTLVENRGFITEVSFGKLEDKEIIYQETPLLIQTKDELDEYFKGLRTSFSIPLKPKGTQFQRSVWEALQLIPYGVTNSYQDVATKIGNPKGSRAVGLANNKNPIAILIPCHRVIGKNGQLVGYGGGLDKKVLLLNLEKNNK